MTLRYVLIPKFCADSGYSEKAVRRKIEDGIWLQNRHYRRAPDGHIMIDRVGVAELEGVAALEAPNIIEPAPAVQHAPTCGVYLLLTAGVVVYVGRSTALKARLRTHRASGRDFDEVRVIPCDAETAGWLEAELIRTLQPSQNLIRYARRAAATARQLVGLDL